jgi:hypothetical protein
VRVGQPRVLQAREGQPASHELGVGRIAAGGEPRMRGDGVGAAAVAGLQGGDGL